MYAQNLEQTMRLPQKILELAALIMALLFVPATSYFIWNNMVLRTAVSPLFCTSSVPTGDEHNSVGIENELAYGTPRCRFASGRRQWLRTTAFSVAANSAAAVIGIDLDSPTMPHNADKICEPTVESYRKKDKHIHILGTSHVSSASAELAGDLVKEVKVCASEYLLVTSCSMLH